MGDEATGDAGAEEDTETGEGGTKMVQALETGVAGDEVAGGVQESATEMAEETGQRRRAEGEEGEGGDMAGMRNRARTGTQDGAEQAAGDRAGHRMG